MATKKTTKTTKVVTKQAVKPTVKAVTKAVELSPVEETIKGLEAILNVTLDSELADKLSFTLDILKNIK